MKIGTKVQGWLDRSVGAMVIEIYPPTPIMVTACVNLLLPPLPKKLHFGIYEQCPFMS